MGKGDQRSRRGKIWRGTFGKRRPKKKNIVKATGQPVAPPQVNVDLRKRRQVARAARGYRRMFGLIDAPYRYDVVTVVSPSAKHNDTEPRIDLLKNYWTDEKLRQRNWREARWD